MNTLFKILLISSPILALIFYYTVIKQSEINTQIKHADAQFERDFNEFSAELEKDPDAKAKYQARADESQQEIEELEPEVEQKKGKTDKFSTEFETAMDEFEKMQKEKGGK